MADTEDIYGLNDDEKDLVESIGDVRPEQVSDRDYAAELLPETQPTVAEPVFEGPQTAIDQQLDDIAATPSPLPQDKAAAGKGGPAQTEATIAAQGDLERQQAQIQADVADQQAEHAAQANMDARLAYADYLERRKVAEQNLDRRIKELDAAKFTDPRKEDVWKNRIAVIFGALGAGQAGGSNTALEAVQKKWHDNAERQKANIALLQDNVAIARTGIKDANEARQSLVDAANAQLLSNYNVAIKQGERQLKKLGVPAADIAQDQRLQKLQLDRAAAKALADKQRDEHELKRSQIELNKARAAREIARGRTGRIGGGSGALNKFVAAANALKPGDAISPEVAELGRQAGLKPNQIAAEVDRYRNSDDKSIGGGRGPRNSKDLADLDEGVRALDRLIEQIKTNPKAWNEYTENAKEWARKKGLRESGTGKFLQFFNLMDLRAEEGLKSEQAKTLFQRQEKLNTSIAKGFGGVITEGDREAAASNQANFALTAPEKIKQLQEMRDDAIAKRNAYVSGAKATPSGTAQSGGSTPAKQTYSAKDIAAAKLVQKDPGSYAPADRAKASKILQSLVQ